MKLIKVSACALALMMAAPVWASTVTYFGGFEDTVDTRTHSSDYDYNDVVFSITGTGLTLNSAGKWYAPVVPNNNGSPFWDNSSSDAGQGNIGNCMYGPGADCKGFGGQDVGGNFLASSSSANNSANDVFFAVAAGGGVSPQIIVTITSDTDALGWVAVNSSGHVTSATINCITSGTAFDTGGSDFELVGIVGGNGSGNCSHGTDYYSETSDNTSQFAFFETPAVAATPEPSSLMLLGSGLLGIAGATRRRFGRK